MRSLTRISLALAGSAALVGSMALPASAVDTTATVTVSGGVLTMTAPTTLAFGSIAPGGTATGALADVAVNDARAGVIGWSSTVTLGVFTSVTRPAAGFTASSFSYASGAAVETGTVTVTAATASASGGAVQTATDVSGNNTATWGSTVSVGIPANALAASDLTAVLTHSVS
jgi:hypothetical protein